MPAKFSEPFFVINGDIITTVNFEELLSFHNENKAHGTMCVRKYDVKIPYGVVKTTGREILSITEKPVHSFYVNSGIYVLDPSMIDLVPKNSFFDMPSLFEEIIRYKKKAVTYELVDYWVDIGLPGDFEKAKNDILIAESNDSSEILSNS